MKRFRWLPLIGLVLLLLVACSEEEGYKYEQQSVTMAQDIIHARLSNISFAEQGEVFEKYSTLIAEDVWANWFDVSDEVVKYNLGLAERLSAYPTGHQITLLSKGIPLNTEFTGEDGFTVIAIAEMDAKTVADIERKFRIHYLFDFDKNGVLKRFISWDSEVYEDE